jgi:hypothetical protein
MLGLIFDPENEDSTALRNVGGLHVRTFQKTALFTTTTVFLSWLVI